MPQPAFLKAPVAVSADLDIQEETAAELNQSKESFKKTVEKKNQQTNEAEL